MGSATSELYFADIFTTISTTITSITTTTTFIIFQEIHHTKYLHYFI